MYVKREKKKKAKKQILRNSHENEENGATFPEMRRNFEIVVRVLFNTAFFGGLRKFAHIFSLANKLLIDRPVYKTTRKESNSAILPLATS